jgi:type I restriction enzyme S subunit
MKARMVRVGELALNQSGAFKIGPFGSSLKKTELVESGIPVAGIENVLPNRFVKGFRRFITPTKFDELSDYEILADDVLVTTMGTIGRAAPAPPDLGRAIFDSHLFRMRVDRERVFPPYLCYALNSDLVASQLARMARGAIMEGLNTTILRECLIPLPELAEQRRVARHLAQASQLSHTRRYALDLTDMFLPAAFLAIFGDFIENPKKWSVVELGDQIEFITSGSRGWATHYAEHGDVFLRIQNVGKGRLLLNDLAYVQPPDNAEARRTQVRPGDVLLSITADLGRSAPVPEGFPPAFINQHLAILRTRGLDPVFLSALLSCDAAKRRWRAIDKNAVKSGLNFDDIRGFKIIMPPLTLQHEYATLAERAVRLDGTQREALRQADHLFASLLHQAFSG